MKEKTYRTILLAVASLLALPGIYIKAKSSMLNPLSSDSAQGALYFYDLIQNGNYLFKDWVVVRNHYFLTDFPFSLVSGLVFGMGPFALKLGALMIFLASAAMLMTSVSKSFGWNSGLIALLTILFAGSFATNILVQPYIHIGTVAYSFLTLAIIIAGYKSERMQQGSVHAYISFLTAFIPSFSDPYYFFFCLMPLGLTLILMKAIRIQTISVYRIWKIFAALVAGAVSGSAASALLSNYFFQTINLSPKIISPQDITSSAKHLIVSIGLLFSIIPSVNGFGAPLDNLFASVNITYFIAGFMCLAIITAKEKDALKRYVLAYFITTSAIMAAQYLLLQKPLVPSTARYLAPLIYIHAAAIGITVCGRYFSSKFRIFIVALLVLSAINAFSGAIGQTKSPQEQEALLNFLREKKLTYGYATYNNANVTTMLSGNSMKVRTIDFDNNGIRPKIWLSKFSWYMPLAYAGPTFLALDGSEVSKAYINNISEPDDVYEYEGYYISVWPYNIMWHFMPSVEISPNTPHTAGMFEKPSMRGFMHSAEGDSGFLVQGTYWQLEKGRYSAFFRIRSNDTEGGTVAVLSVREYASSGNYLGDIASMEVPASSDGKWSPYILDFNIDGSGDNSRYELGVFVTGEADVKVSDIYIEKQN